MKSSSGKIPIRGSFVALSAAVLVFGMGLIASAADLEDIPAPGKNAAQPAAEPGMGVLVSSAGWEAPSTRAAAVPVRVEVYDFEMQEAIDWPTFLAAKDLVWTATPKQWNEGGFTGNGMLGLMAYATLDDNRFDFHLGRSDVTDHRGAPGEKSSFGVMGRNVMFDFCRLDVGRMALRPAGKIKSVTMRQHLWNAELCGTIETDLGTLEFRAFTPRNEMVHIIDLVSREKTPDGRDAEWSWEFLHGNPDSPRFQIIGRERAPNYEQNPRPVLKDIDGVQVVEQRLLAGGCYATAWQEVRPGERQARLIVSTANEKPPAGSSAPVAAETVRRLAAMDFEELLHAHREAWHDLYRRSFLTVPDPRLESFYWIQIYKFASAARENGPPVDLLGPWFRITIWPGIWWNLNVQLTYWLPGTANHLDLSRTLPDYMDRYWETMLARYGKGRHPGDLAWALHNYWLHYRLAGDWDTLAQKWQPKALEMLEAYRDKIEEGPDGRLHLTPMGSPEFKGFEPFKNTNYNLALIRWLALSVEEVHKRTGAGPEEAEEWSAISRRLVDPPVDEHGFMIGSDQSFDETHRHFSHLIGFYPLHIFDADKAEMYALLRKSIRHWLELTNAQGKKDRCGYTVAAAASLQAAIGNGEQAYELLDGLLDNDLGPTLYGSRILPNTFYTEVNGLYPTIETPFAAASATIEMLLQSWGGKVRVFPAVPDSWENARFHKLRAQGGFLVSAARKAGRTSWVAIESTTAEDIVLLVPDWQEELVARTNCVLEVRSLGGGEFAIHLPKGGRVLLSPAAAPVDDVTIQALPREVNESHFYGVRPDNQLEEYQSSPYDIPLRLQ